MSRSLYVSRAGKGVTEYFPGGSWRDYEARDAPTIGELLSRLDDARFPPPPGFRRGGPVAVIGYRRGYEAARVFALNCLLLLKHMAHAALG